VFTLARVASYVTLIFLAALAIIVLMQLLNGAINTHRLLHGREEDDRLYFSPARVQLLVFTIWAAFSYLLEAVEKRGSGKLPEVSTETLALLGGSHAIYLTGKAYSMLFKKKVKGD
jgi:hypothetical protein